MKAGFAICATAALLCALSCSGPKTSREAASSRAFPVVRVPEILSEDPAGEQAFIIEHYWDSFADTSRSYLCDSAHVAGVDAEEVERQFSNFVYFLKSCDLDQARAGMRAMFEAGAACEEADTSSNVLETFIELSDKYLYNPNSPVRDEDIYGAFAAELASYGGFSPEKRSIYAYEARMCALNARGTKAADFVFRDARGKDRHLYDIKADYILLFFSNPGCPACKEIIRTLSEELEVDSMIASGKLAVLNIYIDEDLTAWRDYMPIYPENWYNGYDPYLKIRQDIVYNVRAIPSLYLLSGDKTVLLKDAPDEEMFEEIVLIETDN